MYKNLESTIRDLYKDKQLDEGHAMSRAQQAAIAISKKEKGEKPKGEKDEGNAFGAALQAAKKNGDKTFVVGGKKYDVNTEEEIKEEQVDEAKLHLFDKEKDARDYAKKIKGKYVKGTGKSAGKHAVIQEEQLREDGHSDVPSAIRKSKTMIEDANEIMSKLQSMANDDSLPSWWTNKLAVASDSMNKLRDYILNPVEESVEEETELTEEPSMNQVMAVMGPTKNAKEGVAAIMKAFKVDEKKAMKLLDAAIKKALGESIDEETLDELSIMTLNRYYKKALQAIHKSRKSHDASIMRGMDPSKDKATISKRARGVNLAKSRALKKVRGEEVTEDDALKDVAKKLKGASKKHAKQADVIMKHVKDMGEGRMKDMAIDMKDMPADEFQRKYNMSKADAKEKFGRPQEEIQTEPATNKLLVHNFIQKLVKEMQ